jgi:hypothetical protein
MDIIIWLITLLLLVGQAGEPGGQPVQPIFPTPTPVEEADMVQVPHVIESVDALLLESFPVQIQLHVTGYQPDGCEFPVQVEQQRDGNDVTVRIYRTVPVDVVCPLMIVGYDEMIRLEGGFESGTYTIDVNGTTVEVTI